MTPENSGLTKLNTNKTFFTELVCCKTFLVRFSSLSGNELVQFVSSVNRGVYGFAFYLSKAACVLFSKY
jgi:hypothetical protein